MELGEDCGVEGCASEAIALQQIKDRDGSFDWPAEFPLCGPHRDELLDPSTEWVLLNERDGRRLLVGEALQELNEYILMEPINEIVGHGASRDFSRWEHGGYHLPLKVRRRGGQLETITLVTPPGNTFKESAEFLYRSIPGEPQ